jgi:hypothetical protein
MSTYAIAWAWAFAFTQVVEIPVYRRLLGCGLLRAFGASALTHPLIWLWFPYARGPYVLIILSAELFAWLAEALYFARPYGLRRAVFASLLANGTSFVLGVISRALFDWP